MTEITPEEVAKMLQALRQLADFDSRAGEPLGKEMRNAADMLEALAACVAELEADRTKGADDYCKMVERHDAEFVRAELLAAENARLREYYEASEAFAAEKTTGSGMHLVRARAALNTKEQIK